jgi:hypothetical protein
MLGKQNDQPAQIATVISAPPSRIHEGIAGISKKYEC